MSEKRRFFHPIWEKDIPMREDQLAFLKAMLILLIIILVFGCAPMVLGGIYPLDIFGWIALGGWIAALLWLIIGGFPPAERIRKQRRKQKKENERIKNQK